MVKLVPHGWQVGGSHVTVGRCSYGYEDLCIREWGEGAALAIGAFCSLAAGTTIFLGGNHRTDWITTYPFGHILREELGGGDIAGHPATSGDVTIGNDVWIGHGVTVMSGVTVGDGAVLGANATVARDVEPYAIVAGNPARTVRHRFTPEIRALLLELRWWDLPLDTVKAIIPELSAPPTVDGLRALIARVR